MYCSKKCDFERIEANNKTNVILEKSDRFVYENV